MHSLEVSSPSALLITGTVGAGKTSVAEAVGDTLSQAEEPNAVIDLDWLRRSWPSPPGDRFNSEIELRNLRDVARNYLDRGPMRLVLAGVIETRADRDRCQDSVGVPLTVCRLDVELSLVRSRLARRHELDLAALHWHLDRSGELDAILQAARVEDHVVVVGDSSVREAALAVVETVGLQLSSAP